MGSNGVETYSSQPVASATSRNWSAPYADTATIGTLLSDGTSRIRRVAERPSSRGISMSIIIRSGVSLVARLMASSPFSASTTRKPRRSNQIRSSSRLSSKSSTTSIVRIEEAVTSSSVDRMLTRASSSDWRSHTYAVDSALARYLFKSQVRCNKH